MVFFFKVGFAVFSVRLFGLIDLGEQKDEEDEEQSGGQIVQQESVPQYLIAGHHTAGACLQHEDDGRRVDEESGAEHAGCAGHDQDSGFFAFHFDAQRLDDAVGKGGHDHVGIGKGDGAENDADDEAAPDGTIDRAAGTDDDPSGDAGQESTVGERFRQDKGADDNENDGRRPAGEADIGRGDACDIIHDRHQESRNKGH